MGTIKLAGREREETDGDSRLSIERSSTAAPLPPPGAVHKQPICARLLRL
jgi:hypothetical protein